MQLSGGRNVPDLSQFCRKETGSSITDQFVVHICET